MGVSVLILTLNEAANIEECLDSVKWSDDVVVFDSLSTDDTRELAAARGVRIFERAFDNFAAQRNAALSTVPFKHPWVWMMDADERVPADLATEILAAAQTAAPTTTLFRVRRKDYFLGRWLRRSSGYPTWAVRLVRLGSVAIEREVHEAFVSDGQKMLLKGHFLHFPFNKGLAYWYERHNRYSTMEAMAKLADQSARLAPRDLLSSDPAVRRRALKQLAYRLPFRPQLVFLYLYVWRLGLLDGRAGYYYSLMRASYELSIDLKVLEIERRRERMPV